jgi:hypothetical protein
MIKRYCDTCAKEMTDRNTPNLGTNSGRLQATIKRLYTKLTVEVIQSTNAGANSGDICKHCILDALYELDDRPQASNAEVSEGGTRDSRIETAAQSRPSLH